MNAFSPEPRKRRELATSGTISIQTSGHSVVSGSTAERGVVLCSGDLGPRQRLQLDAKGLVPPPIIVGIEFIDGYKRNESYVYASSFLCLFGCLDNLRPVLALHTNS